MNKKLSKKRFLIALWRLGIIDDKEWVSAHLIKWRCW